MYYPYFWFLKQIHVTQARMHVRRKIDILEFFYVRRRTSTSLSLLVSRTFADGTVGSETSFTLEHSMILFLDPLSLH
jgi:hypothetical protein